MQNELKAGVYLHYTELIVLVIGVARHSETEEKLVAYIPMAVKDNPRITVRPYDMFFEEVEVNGQKQPRFKYLGETIPSELASQYSPLSK